MSVPMRASSTRRGALPGRNPGMRTSRASLRKARSTAFSNSSAETPTRRRTLLSSRVSTLVSIRDRIVAPDLPGSSPRRLSLAELGVAGERFAALGGVVDDRGRVTSRWAGGQGPRLVDVSAGDAGQLRYPPADVLAVGVELAALQQGVEDPEEGGGIGAGPGGPLPAVLVRGEVAVDEQLHEVAGAPAPVEVEVLDQEAGHDHPHAVVHPRLGAQLAHPGVDDRVTGSALPPGVEPLVGLPALVPFHL